MTTPNAPTVEPWTRDQFETHYAEVCGLDVERLRAMGFSPQPCDCGALDCHGWIMAGNMAQLAEFMVEAMITAMDGVSGSASNEEASQDGRADRSE